MYGIWLAFAAAGFRICAKGTWPLFILSFHSKNCTLSVTFHNGLSVRYLRIASVNSGIVPLPFSSISGFLHSLLGILRMCWLVSPSPHSLIRGNLLIIWLPCFTWTLYSFNRSQGLIERNGLLHLMRLEEHEKDKLLTWYFLFYWKRYEIPSLIESGKHFPFPAWEFFTFCLQALFKLPRM